MPGKILCPQSLTEWQKSDRKGQVVIKVACHNCRQKQLYEQEKQLRSLQLEAVKQLYKEVQSLQKWKEEVLQSQEVRHSVSVSSQPKVNLAGAEQLIATLERARLVVWYLELHFTNQALTLQHGAYLGTCPQNTDALSLEVNIVPRIPPNNIIYLCSVDTLDPAQTSTPTKPGASNLPPRSCASPQTTQSALPVPMDSVLPSSVCIWYKIWILATKKFFMVKWCQIFIICFISNELLFCLTGWSKSERNWIRKCL